MNTQIDAAELLPVLQEAYSLPQPLSCEFLRRGFNDHYLVTAGPRQFIFRAYFNGKYYIEGDGDLLFELELLDFLHAGGVPVSRVVRRRDGAFLTLADTPLGARRLALFTFAEGQEGAKLDPEPARRLGETVANLHLTADRFRTGYHRYHLDEQILVGQPLILMKEFLEEHRPGRFATYRHQLEALRARLAALPRAEGAYGIIHGDLHNRNLRVRDDGSFIFYDFDHGGYGWRVYDLGACFGVLPEESRGAFVEGYESVRRMEPWEQESITLFQSIRSVWDIGDVLAYRLAWGDTMPFGPEYADRILSTLEKSFAIGSAVP